MPLQLNHGHCEICNEYKELKAVSLFNTPNYRKLLAKSYSIQEYNILESKMLVCNSCLPVKLDVRLASPLLHPVDIRAKLDNGHIMCQHCLDGVDNMSIAYYSMRKFPMLYQGHYYDTLHNTLNLCKHHAEMYAAKYWRKPVILIDCIHG